MHSRERDEQLHRSAFAQVTERRDVLPTQRAYWRAWLGSVPSSVALFVCLQHERCGYDDTCQLDVESSRLAECYCCAATRPVNV